MVNRNRQLPFRTPRKEKIWIGKTILNPQPITVRAITAELLADGLADIGLVKSIGVTVMRVFGSVQLVAWGGATTPAYADVSFGFAWVPNAIATAGLDDAQIPVPMATGVRQIRWTYQSRMGGLEYEAPIVLSTPLLPVEDSIVKIDSTQMAKQPTVDHDFCMIQEGPQVVETNTIAIKADLQIMLALP